MTTRRIVCANTHPALRKPPVRIVPTPNDYTKVVQAFAALYTAFCAHRITLGDALREIRAALPVGATELHIVSDPFVLTYSLNGQLLRLRASAFGVRYNEPRSLP